MIKILQAVALKALAGVALIGAAAALATNPILLPLGVLSTGRKKRSARIDVDQEITNDRIVDALRAFPTKV